MTMPTVTRIAIAFWTDTLLRTARGRMDKWEDSRPGRAISGRRSNIFYVGEPVKFTLKGNAAVRYEVRDYYGNVVDKGTPAEVTTLNVKEPGWYKLYLYGAEKVEPWGDSVGGTMFAIIRDDPNFPRLPDGSEPGGEYAAGRPYPLDPRHRARSGTRPRTPASRMRPSSEIEKGIAMEAKYYLPYDKSRKRVLLVAFPNGTENIEGVRKIVEHFKDVVHVLGADATSRTTATTARSSSRRN